MKKILSPSLLAADFAHLADDLAQVAAAEWIHIDVMDGVFVPNISLGAPVIRAVKRSVSCHMDVHLMVTKPIRLLDGFIQAGSNGITLHLESDTQENTLEALRIIRAAGLIPGLSIKPATPPDAILPYLPHVDLILVMTVEPGFGGQAMLSGSAERVRAVRALLDAHHPQCHLEVDGGITLENVRPLAEAGANAFVCGTSVFGAPDMGAAVTSFMEIIRGA